MQINSQEIDQQHMSPLLPSQPSPQLISCLPAVDLEEKIDILNLSSSFLQPSEKQADISIDTEAIYKKTEPAKTKYLRLKHKLSNVCYKHVQISFGRQITTPNKPRLMKLAIEMQRQVNSQVHNYGQMESTLKQLWKIVEYKKQNDLQILRQSRFIPSLMEFFKRLLSSHRNQYKEALKVLDTCTMLFYSAMRLLMTFCTVNSNRQYLLLTNRFQTLTSLLSWALLKKDEMGDCRIVANLVTTLCYLLQHRFEGDSTRILELSLEIVFYSQLLKRIKNVIEVSITEEGIFDEPMVKALLRFLVSLLVQVDPQCQMKPVYEQPTQNIFCTSNFQWLAHVVSQLFNAILINRDNGECEMNLGSSQIAILLYGVRLLNVSCRLNLSLIQKIISQQMLVLMEHIIHNGKENFDVSLDTKQLLNEAIILVGYLSLCNPTIQNRILEVGILLQLCNLPTKFIIDKKLVQILMPTLCCLIHRNQSNMNMVFGQMSSLHMKKFLQAQMKLRPTVGTNSAMHSRKLSLSSSNSIMTQCSSVNLSINCLVHSPYSLKMRFPHSQWAQIYDALEKVE